MSFGVCAEYEVGVGRSGELRGSKMEIKANLRNFFEILNSTKT